MTEAKPAIADPMSDADLEALRASVAQRPLSPRLASIIARIDAERAARLAAEARVKVLTEVLRTVQWDVRGKCTACAGWNMSPSGETVKAHTADCPVAAALQEPAND